MGNVENTPDLVEITDERFEELCASGAVLAPNLGVHDLLPEAGSGITMIAPIVIEIVAVVVGIIVGEIVGTIAGVIANRIAGPRQEGRTPLRPAQSLGSALDFVSALQARPWGEATEVAIASA